MPDTFRTDRATAIYRAKVACLNVTGLALAEGIAVDQLRLLLMLPAEIVRALTEQRKALKTMAQHLAAEAGDTWSELLPERKTSLHTKAFDLVENLPAPFIPHASTPPYDF